MKKSWIVMLSVMSLVALAACSGGTTQENNNSGNEPQASATPEAKKGEPVKLVLVSDGGETEANEIIPTLQKKFPNYTFEYVNGDEEKKGGKAALINAGQQMDIDFDSIGSYSRSVLKYELQYDMSELVKKHGIDLNRFDKSMIDAIRTMSGGKLTGIPVSNSPLTMFYNKDLFDKFGVPYPKDSMTWEEVMEIGKKMTRNEGGKQYYGISFNENRMLNVNQLSIPYYDANTKKPTINTNDQWSKLLQTVYLPILNMPGYKEARVATKKELPQDDDFLKGEVAMIVSSIDNTKLEKVDFKWDFVALPEFKDKKGVTFSAYPTYYSVLQTSKHKDEAMEVIKYLTSDEFQIERAKRGVHPSVKTASVKDSLGQDTKFKDKNWKSYFVGEPAPISAKSIYDKDIEKAYRNSFRSILFDGVDVNSALKKAEEEAQKVIK